MIVLFMLTGDFTTTLYKIEPTTTVYPLPRVSIIPEQAEILMHILGDNKAYRLK